ncbi:MAG: DUF427 domain-containing protein [Geminicoccaceae bacterium]
MSRSVDDAPYRLQVTPVEGHVVARAGNVVLAASDRALIMRETRQPPAIYFPKEDALVLEPEPSRRRTFCPFKGTATYWNLNLDGRMVSDGAWSYERTLVDARDIEGRVAFFPKFVDRFDGPDDVLHRTDDGHVSGELVDWLMREAWLCRDPVALTRALGNRFVEDGISVLRLNVCIWSLHPQHAGIAYIWRRDTDDVETRQASYDDLASVAFRNSPIRYVSEGLGGVRQSLRTDAAEFSFPIMADLKAEGCTDYVAMPLPFSTGQIHVMTMASDRPGGFTTADLGLIFECSTVISRFYEVLAQRANAEALLETYLGEGTGARVLGGEIRRGDGDDIEAAILFCDLRESTRWEERLDRDEYLSLLNAFFEAVVVDVRRRGGEVLKFVGDGVLAVFPSNDDERGARSRALKAASEIVHSVETLPRPGAGEPVDCSIGIGFGRVTYGNVGSEDRLDFTVIGRPAIVAARLSDLAKTCGHAILATADIAAVANDRMTPIGMQRLHNISEPVDVFALSSSAGEKRVPV